MDECIFDPLSCIQQYSSFTSCGGFHFWRIRVISSWNVTCFGLEVERCCAVSLLFIYILFLMLCNMLWALAIAHFWGVEHRQEAHWMRDSAGEIGLGYRAITWVSICVRLSFCWPVRNVAQQQWWCCGQQLRNGARRLLSSHKSARQEEMRVVRFIIFVNILILLSGFHYNANKKSA